MVVNWSMKLLRIISQMFFICVCACGLLFFIIGALLSWQDSAGKADVIVCLSCSNARIEKAIALLQQGLADRVAVTTDEVYSIMLAKKVLPGQILNAHWSATSTYEEGILLKTLLAGKYTTALVVTDPFHLYRTKWTFRHIFAENSITFSFISSDDPSLQGFWWSKANSRLFVLSELPKIFYYWLWHGLLGIVEDMAWAIELERVYQNYIQDVFAGRGA